MKVADIIKQVRWCIDEECGYDDMENAYMDKIIKAKIGDALRFVCLYGNASLLTGGTSSNSDDEDESSNNSYSVIEDFELPKESSDDEAPYIDSTSTSVCSIVLPDDFLKVVRVKATGWHRAIMSPISEDSDEYLMLSDDCAKATKDRPQVALIATNPMRLEVYPKPENNDKISLTIVRDASLDDSASDSSSSGSGQTTTTDIDYNIPPKAMTAFIYYIAYLVLCAYNDANKASLMLSIVKQHLGIQ